MGHRSYYQRKAGSFMLRKYTSMAAVALLIVLNASGITVSSLEELVAAAANSGQSITMTPGTYRMDDYLTSTVKNNIVADEYGRKAMITFSGHNNTFDFSGVIIEVNTELLNDLGSGVMEFSVTGNGNVVEGLTITDMGMEPTASGGQSFVVMGDDVTIRDVTINMRGSSPYGYGDLLGKGSNRLVPMRKHSGMLISGLNVNVIGCSIYSESFGHLFFVQGGRNVLFQDCYAEAVTRTTDAMLAETSGTAFDLNFESIYPNYDGEKVITSGYTKSLSECGFRTYGSGANGHDTGVVRAINCKAVGCRIGFAFTRVNEDMLIRDCEAIECESAYNITGVTIENSRGDAVNGPLLYINTGAISTVDLYLMETAPTTTVHAIACIPGDDHVVSLKRWEGSTRVEKHYIRVGSTRSTASNPFSPLGTDATSGITLTNYTGMPVILGSTVSSSTVISDGTITDEGSGNAVTLDRDAAPVGHWMFNDGMGSVAADSSGNGYDGTVENAEWVVGASSGALDFNGVNSRVVLPAAAFDPIKYEVSVSMWVYGHSVQPLADTSFYAWNDNGKRVLNVHLPYSNSTVFWDAGYEGSYDRIEKLAVGSEIKGQWNHWVFSKNTAAGSMKIYLNGSLWMSGSGKTREMNDFMGASIGAQNSSRHYTGLIDDVRLYDMALTASEIQELYLGYNAEGYAGEVNSAVTGLGSGGSTEPNFTFTLPGSGLGYRFQVHHTESLAEPNWQPASLIVQGTGDELNIDVPLDAAQTNGFYKLEAWRQ